MDKNKNGAVHRARQRLSRWLRRGGEGIVIAAVLLIAARAALPYAVKWYVNRTLDRSDGYTGHVGDVNIALLRGAYQLDDVEIRKKHGTSSVPFFAADRIDISIEWRQVLNRRLVGEIEGRHPVLHFVKDKTEQGSQNGEQGHWSERADALVPVRINRIAVRDGVVFYHNKTTTPEIDAHLSAINGDIRNLSYGDKYAGSLVAVT
jgi:hypothetical protein